MTTEESFAVVAGFIDSVSFIGLEPLCRQALTVKLKVGCPAAEKHHSRSPRVHAHALHYPWRICVVQDFEDLPDEHKLGILLHEFGHVYGGYDDADADLWVEETLGIDIRYVDTVQWVPVEEVLG